MKTIQFQRKIRKIIIIAVVLGLIIHFASPMFADTFFENWRWIHIPIHSVVEIAGSFIAILVAFILINQEKVGKGTSFNTWIAGALFGMGVLDGMHAILYISNDWSWFHGIASLWGGILFSCVWISENIRRKIEPYWPRIVIVVTALLCIAPYLSTKFTVPMIVDGQFTFTAKFINVAGGSLLIFASLKLLISYLRTKNIDNVLFFMHCLFFGLAAIMFPASKLWDFPFWSWHLLRLMAYAVALWFAVLYQKQIEDDLLDKEVSKKSKVILERLQYVLSETGIGVWDYQLQSKILNWDDRMFKLYGLRKDRFHNSYAEWTSIIHPDDRELFSTTINQATKQLTPYDIKFRIILPNGLTRNIQAKAKVINDEGDLPILLLGINWDITKESEDEKQLIIAKEKAEEANSAKSIFLSNMSHELRTPLNAILGFSKLIKLQKNITETQKEQLNTVHQCGEHLLLLISDILDISKIEAQKYELSISEANLPVILSTIFNINKVKADEKDLEFVLEKSVSLPNYVSGDERKLKQVMLNLINNAIKFTDVGRITVRADYIDDRNAFVFEVEDTGLGIPPEKQDEIFKPFTQLSGKMLFTEGTGLGLSITKKIVEMMDGNLTLKSETDKGSIFRVEIPLLKMNETETKSRHSELQIIRYEGEYKNILVIDDNQTNLSFAVSLLESVGFNTEVAENGQIGLLKMADFKPDLILLDYKMPVMDGLEFAQIVKQNAELNNFKIIGVSATLNYDISSKKFMEICDDFIPKPVDSDLLFVKIKEALKIEWVFENTAEIEDEIANIRLIFPEKHTLLAIEECAEMGDFNTINKLLDEIVSTNSEYAVFCKLIKKYSKNYDAKSILQALSKHNKLKL